MYLWLSGVCSFSIPQKPGSHRLSVGLTVTAACPEHFLASDGRQYFCFSYDLSVFDSLIIVLLVLIFLDKTWEQRTNTKVRLVMESHLAHLVLNYFLSLTINFLIYRMRELMW